MSRATPSLLVFVDLLVDLVIVRPRGQTYPPSTRKRSSSGTGTKNALRLHAVFRRVRSHDTIVIYESDVLFLYMRPIWLIGWVADRFIDWLENR